MEPAVYRREHPAPSARHATARAVAMEPAVYRREHQGGDLVGRDPGQVAMEPAVYRREHRVTSIRACPTTGSSQWSPPFIGGSTCGRRAGTTARRGRNGARRL